MKQVVFFAVVLGMLLFAPLCGQDTSRDSKAELLEPATLAAWGTEALAQIQKDLSQPDSALYAEYGTRDGRRGGDFGKYAFIWPSSYQVRALAAAAYVRPQTYLPTLTRFTDALDQYWIVKNGIGGYAVLPNGSERYYDDNACMVLALLDICEVTHQRKYLVRAALALEFVASGEKKFACR